MGVIDYHRHAISYSKSPGHLMPITLDKSLDRNAHKIFICMLLLLYLSCMLHFQMFGVNISSVSFYVTAASLATFTKRSTS